MRKLCDMHLELHRKLVKQNQCRQDLHAALSALKYDVIVPTFVAICPWPSICFSLCHQKSLFQTCDLRLSPTQYPRHVISTISFDLSDPVHTETQFSAVMAPSWILKQERPLYTNSVIFFLPFTLSCTTT